MPAPNFQFKLRYDLRPVVKACHEHQRASMRYVHGRAATPRKNWPADGSWNPPPPLVKSIMAACNLDEQTSNRALAMAEHLELIRRAAFYGEVTVLPKGLLMIGLAESEPELEPDRGFWWEGGGRPGHP